MTTTTARRVGSAIVRGALVVLWVLPALPAPGQPHDRLPGGGEKAAEAGTGWQVYRNAKYGYEIQYPRGFDLWPTGPEGQRDGSTIRIALKERAAPTPVLDVAVRADRSDLERIADEPPRDMDVVFEDVEIDGEPARQVTFRWKENGEIVFVQIFRGDVELVFSASPGTTDFRDTVWWEIVSTFRSESGQRPIDP